MPHPNPLPGLPLLLLLAALPLGAQELPDTLGTISGTVVDSTRAEPLVGAEVYLAGTGIRDRTGSDGEYRLAGVPPGEYRIGFRHPRFGPLGLKEEQVLIIVSPGARLGMDFGIPSLTTIGSRFCPRGLSEETPAFLTGFVLEPEVRRGIPGAVVEAAWMGEDTFGNLRAVTDNSGRYVLCGLPLGTEVNLRAGAGQSLSTPAVLTLEEDRLTERNLTLFPQAVTRVVGRVVDAKSGNGVGGAEVRLKGTGYRTITAGSGRFQLDQVRMGAYLMEVEHLAYGVLSDSIEAGQGTVDIQVAASRQAIELEGFTVVARPARLENTGFYQRSERGMGQFISRHDFLRRKPLRLTDMLGAVPGVVLVPGQGASDYSLLLRNRCQPTYIVDGQHQPRAYFQLDQIHPRFIHGVEIYPTVATIPVQYRNPQFEGLGDAPENPCGVVVIWTGPAGRWDR